ncbi:MAG: hypothetical protein KF901_31000, partial [Myxococcales bacterium]|nr:hypothetical protein [Myxococcales bacterium]
MGNHLSIRTACHDNGEAIALLARELDQGDLVLEATEPVDAGAWIAFEVLLGDGQLFLEGMGRCLESRAAAGRRRVRLGELQLDAAGELLFERIQIARDDLEHGGRHTAMLIELPELSEERTTIGVTLRDSYEDIPPPSPSLGLGRAFSAPPLARPRTASPPPLPRAESAPAESAPKVTSSSPPPLPAGRSASLAPSPKAPIAPTPSSAPPSSTAPSAASQARSARPAASPSARPALPRRREVVDLATDMMQAGPRPTPARRPASSRRDEELATDETKAVVAPSARAERPAPPRKGVPSGAASPTGPVSTRRGGASIATAPAEAPGRTASSRGGVAPSAPAPATAAPSAPSPALATTAST